MNDSEMLGLVSVPPTKRPRSAGEQAYQKMRLEILTFGLQPGEMVSEMSLAQRFDLSIAAVRAALPRLRQEGLLVNQGRRGQMVRPVTLGDIEETCDLRYLLEPVAAEKAVGKLDAEILKELNKKTSFQPRSDDRASELETIFANRDFHMTIAEKCGNSQLAECLRDLHDKVVRFQYLLRHSKVRGSGWQESHDDIIAAFEKGDPHMAAEAMREHTRTAGEFIMQAVMEFPEVRYLHLGRSQANARRDDEPLSSEDPSDLKLHSSTD